MSRQVKAMIVLDDDDDDEILVTCSRPKAVSLSQKLKSKSISGKSGSISSGKKKCWISSSFDGFEESFTSQDSKRKKKQSDLSSSYFSGYSTSVVKTAKKDDELWLDKYKPNTESELAVHKKKIAEVRSWLLEHICEKQSNAILLLTGPVGAGKTATLQMLSTELSFEIQEWINPTTDEEFNREDYSSCQISYQSQLSQFKDFLLQSNKYPTLSIFGNSNKTATRKVILLEDLPNIFFRDAKKLHAVLQSYHSTGRSPVVLIISDSRHGDSNVHRLLPKSIQESLGITNISFNPVAHTSLAKTLNRIATSESQKAGRDFMLPSKETIEELANSSTGDIRTAINALQFTCQRDCSVQCKKGITKGSRSSSQKPSKPSSIPKGSCLSKLSRKSTSHSNGSAEVTAIGGRDSTLFLFRALGKILYCKRDPVASDKELLPSNLMHCTRNTPQFCPEEVAERAHLSSEILNMYLHQNYLDFFTDLDNVEKALEYMSDADMMTAVWMHRSSLIPYMASIVTRGLMFTHSSTSSSKGGFRPLHKPQWFEINKRMRDSIQMARDLFPGQTCPTTVLHTEVLPYLAITDAPLQSPGQIAFLEQIGRFQRGRSYCRSYTPMLDEKDCGGDSDEELPGSQPESSTVRQIQESGTRELDARGLVTPEEEILSCEEDIVIEDFDDDEAW